MKDKERLPLKKKLEKGYLLKTDKSFNEENLWKLTERQIKGALIKKNYSQEKLKRVTNAFEYVQSTGTKVDADTLQRYEQVRKKVAKQLSICIRFLQAQRVKTLEESKPASPVKTEEDQKVPSHSPIQKKHVSPTGEDTIPPKFRVTTPPKLNVNGMGPTLTESMRERADAIYKTYTIINGHGIKSTPASLEKLTKQVIEGSDQKAFKVPSHATFQLTGFLLHNPGIIDAEQLDWDYEGEDRESQNGEL